MSCPICGARSRGKRLHDLLCLARKWESRVQGRFQTPALLGESCESQWQLMPRHMRYQADYHCFPVQNEFCFLGAGALGTTEILLRSREHGMKMSPLVGRN